MLNVNLPAEVNDAPEAARPLLQAVEKKIGFAPNIYKLIANSPAALEGTLSLSEALGKGALDAKTRERIALAVANVNGCNYCNAAHTAIAGMHNMDSIEIAANRKGRSSDPKAEVAVAFARKVAISRGDVTSSDVQHVRDAGFSDAELVEIVAHVALNVLTNYINEVFGTPIDFPEVEPAGRAA